MRQKKIELALVFMAFLSHETIKVKETNLILVLFKQL